MRHIYKYFTLIILLSLIGCNTTDKQNNISNEIIEDFKVTDEIYKQTFSEVENIIKELNIIIKNKDFDNWLTYLSKEYIKEISSKKYLEDMSNKPLLKKNKIILNSFEDYFNYVVVPSRSNARLDDIIFIDNNTVKAIMIIKKQNTILYLLKKIDNTWKIGI